MEERNSAIEKAEKLANAQEERREKIRRDNEEMESLIDSEEKARKRRKRKPTGFTRLKGAVGVLAVSLAVVTAGFFVRTSVPTESDMMLDAAYRRSLYDAVEQVGSMDLNLSKALSTSDYPALSGYLFDVAIESELLESDLHALPIKEENKVNSAKLVNQIGDFSKSLEKKIVRGETPTDGDYKTLGELYKRNKKLKDALYSAANNAGANYEFDIDAGENDGFLSEFSTLENVSAEYPELIYDGPFSDGTVNREIKGLKKEKITEKAAVSKLKKLFNGYRLRDLKVERSGNETIPSFIITAKVKNDVLLCEIAEYGGDLLNLSRAGSCGAENYDRAGIEELAEKFLNKLGIENIKAVWYSYFNGAYTINYAKEENGTVIYPDMIKIKLCAETGDVIGFEGSSYYKNHTERTIENPTISQEEARKKVHGGIEIESVRLAVIPKGEKSETLCYEFSGEKENETYFVYINAETGAQEEMFKVIDTDEGTLLM